MTNTTKALVGSLLASTFATLLLLQPGCNEGTSRAAGCTKGQPDCLPDLSYVDTNGVAYSAQSLTGKVVVINFWATWCKPCMKEIPDLSKVYAKYKQDVVMLGVLSSDNPDSGTLLNFQSDNEMTYPVVRESSDILMSYDYPRNLPTTFIFDRTGRKVYNHVGALQATKLVEILDPLVGAK
jgi:thiol-disulfide isomerase/thioredoxin